MATPSVLLCCEKATGVWYRGREESEALSGSAGTKHYPKTQVVLGGMRLRPALFWAFMAGLSELGGGLLLALGFLNPLGTLRVISAMLMAIILAHWPRFWAADGGLEYPLLVLASALVVGITGPGRYSLDTALGIAPPAPVTLVAGLILVLLGIGTALATRAPQARTETGGQADNPAHG